MTREEVEKLCVQMDEVQELASRWTRAYETGYLEAVNVRLSFGQGKVFFGRRPMSSGFNVPCEMPIEYLWKPNEVESAAKAAGELAKDQSNAKWQEFRDLEETPQVQRYKRLEEERRMPFWNV